MVMDIYLKEPRWGTENRDVKAQAILTTLRHYSSSDFSGQICLDVGCGNGEIAAYLSDYFNKVIAIDREPWARWIALRSNKKNLYFVKNSAESLSLIDNCIDVIVCNQVYEHVQNLDNLIDEIFRVLKPGGICYFAGPNLLYPIEQHTYWPFVHWIDRGMLVKIMKLFGFDGVFDANAKSYWHITNKLKKFKIENSFPYIIKNPKLYGRYNFFWIALSKIHFILLKFLTVISPGFVFILKKY